MKGFITYYKKNTYFRIINRISAGMRYRFVSDVSLGNLTNADIAGVSGVLTFKFGKF